MTRLLGMAGTACVALTAAAGTFVDVFVAYDQSAKTWIEAQGKTLEGLARENVERMNLCLSNSGLASEFTFRLVGAEAFNVDTGAKMLPEILTDLQDAETASGVMKQVWSRRDALGADLFSFVTGGGIKSAQRGFGWTLGASSTEYGLPEAAAKAALDAEWRKWVADRYCFNVTAVEAIAEANDYTFAHEFAHNMGCGHVNKSEASWQGCYEFSAGHAFAPGFVTVMGYAAEGMTAVVPYYSSPDVMCEGVPTGDAQHDNVRTLRNNYKFVSDYRGAVKTEAAPEDDAEVEEVLGFKPQGAFNPQKAVALNAESPYVGALFDATQNIAGVVLLKVGKANAKKGTSKVSGSVVLLNGKKYAVKGGEVPTGSSPRSTQKAGLVVPKVGTFHLTFGANGFAGSMKGESGGEWAVRTADVMGGLSSRNATFKMFGDVEKLNGMTVITNCLPGGTSVMTVGGKWQLAKAATVKYVKTDADPAGYELVVNTDGGKTNVSGLKLSYAAKTGSFKGGFSFFANAGTADAPKLKKVKAVVTGVVVDGIGYGMATVKGEEPWPVCVE